MPYLQDIINADNVIALTVSSISIVYSPLYISLEGWYEPIELNTDSSLIVYKLWFRILTEIW